MKLREQFKTEVSINTSGESGRFADKCVEIADNYAIGFAEWYWNNSYSLKFKKEDGKYPEYKELLEIYKQEIGL